MKKSAQGIFIFAAIFFLFAPPAAADAVYLSSGEVIKGLVVEEHHDRIVFSTHKGEMEIPRFSIEQIFFDNEEQNYAYLGDRALEEGEFDIALQFYQKADQINPEFEKVNWAFLRLIDAVNRKKLNIQKETAADGLKNQFGITVQRSGDKIKAGSVRAGSAAEKAGMGVGDFIIDAWDASLMFMDAEQAAEAMLGTPNTPIRLTIEKDIALPLEEVPWFKRILRFWQGGNLGFSLSLRPSGLMVAHVDYASPAQKNGLEAGDEVIRINGESTRYMPAALVKRKIFQDNLKEAVLTVRRRLITTREDL